MPDPIITSYKVYDGSNWQEYYLKTTAAAVGVTATRKFLTSDVRVNGNNAGTDGAKVTIDSTGNGANIILNALHIPSNASASSHYMAQTDSVAAALQALDTACYNAYNHVPTNCLTYGNDGNFDDQFPDLYAIEQLSGTNGFLKKTAANTWALDQTVYVPQTRTVNNKALSSDITLGATDIGYTNSAFALANTVGAYLDTLTSVVQGKQNSYAIALNGSGTGVVNSSFNSQNNEVSISATFSVAQGGGYSCDKSIKATNGTLINLATLKVGDNVYITDQEVPDRWVSSITIPTGGGTGTITFTKLETQKVDLTSYATWGNSLSHYGINDAYIQDGVIHLGSNTLAAYIQNGTIHLGTDTITPITSLSSVVPYTGATGDVDLGNHSLYANLVSTAYLQMGLTDFLNDNQNNFVIDVNQGSSSFDVSASNMRLNNKNVATITAGTSSPSSPRVGDIWLDTN